MPTENLGSCPKPRIGLNLLYLRPGRVGGTETYGYSLIKGLQSLGSRYDFVVFLNPEAFPRFAFLDETPSFSRVLCPAPRHPYLRHLWEQMRLPRLCRLHQLDVLHSFGAVIPFLAPCKSVVTIHDVLYKVEPSLLSWTRRNILGALTTLSARRSDLIVTVSESSKSQIVQYLCIAPEKVYVTPEGPGQTFQSLAPWALVRDKYCVPEPYFLAVGTAAHKRMDLVRLATRILGEEKRFSVFVVTTSPIGHSSPAGDSMKHLGYVPTEELASLYKNAIALICFSDMEGFGLTPFEAMGLGTPVVASNAAALPEILGSAGIIVKQGDPRALADAMWKIATDAKLHAEMRARGLRRVGNFSWLQCAAETARAYEEVLEPTVS